ncbi:hypothetical protein [Streptomyces sp. LN704]|uniref:hypothetical protein n=1 Tax=Streptomyces sp. LN704 TaxID=3112982 RepID=UPI0037237D0B
MSHSPPKPRDLQQRPYETGRSPRCTATTEHNLRSNFVFAPPEDNPAAWQPSLETFRDALARTFPDAFLETNTSSLRDVPVLDFEIEVAPDIFVTGTAAMPTPNQAMSASST